MTLDEFEKSYAKSYRAGLTGRASESEALFEQAKREAVRALQQGATPDDLAESMHRARESFR